MLELLLLRHAKSSWDQPGVGDHERTLAPRGEAAAPRMGELLAARGLKVSRLARGVPVGGELEYVDSGTLAQALRERRRIGGGRDHRGLPAVSRSASAPGPGTGRSSC